MTRIFVAEDDENVRMSLLQWFTHLGYEVVAAANGSEASEILKEKDFHALVLDWEMPPGKSGPEVVKEYRARGGDGVVILLTGRGELCDKEIGFEAGVDDYMVKPFHLKELSAKVKILLSRVQPSAAKKQIVKVRTCDLCGTIHDSSTELCADCFVPLLTEDIEFPGGQSFLEKYEMLGVLGRGGMSTVFKAIHRILQKTFAIKFMDAARVKEGDYLRRFELEAEALSRMNHSNVVAIHDYGLSDSKQPYIVMEYVEGLSLFRALNRFESFSLSRFLDVFKQCCRGIGHAHAQGIIHRDLKPANIILSARDGKEQVVIVDFGVAKQLETVERPSEQLTKDGKVFGTTTYMSPEHCLGQALDQRSDIYALGCIMYEVLAGHPPFLGDNVLDTLQKQINDEPLQLSKARDKDDLPPELESIIHKTLEKLPEDRYQSMQELADALECVQAGCPQ